jgi:hypothetical protein
MTPYVTDSTLAHRAYDHSHGATRIPLIRNLHRDDRYMDVKYNASPTPFSYLDARFARRLPNRNDSTSVARSEFDD